MYNISRSAQVKEQSTKKRNVFKDPCVKLLLILLELVFCHVTHCLRRQLIFFFLKNAAAEERGQNPMNTKFTRAICHCLMATGSCYKRQKFPAEPGQSEKLLFY